MTEPYRTASEIALHMTEVLKTITVVNGYETDIGLSVFRGRRKIDDSAVPCAVIVEGDDNPTSEGVPPSMTLVQSYVVGGYVECDPDHPNDAAHRVIRDLKRAFFKDVRDPDYHFGRRVIKIAYKGRDIGPRADGLPIVFAVVHIDITYAENLAEP